MAPVMCQSCHRHRATGIWAITMRLRPDKTTLRVMCAFCGMDSYPSRHGVLRISLVHSLGELSHLEGPECTSNLVPQADAVTINGHFFITCKCLTCGWATQYELSEIHSRIFSNTHINLRHPDNAHRIKVAEAIEQACKAPVASTPSEVRPISSNSCVSVQLWSDCPRQGLSGRTSQAQES